MIDQEYQVMKDLNKLRDFCPHFVKMFSKMRIPVSSNYRRAKNPFIPNSEYKMITTDMLVMQYIEDSKNFSNILKMMIFLHFIYYLLLNNHY